jgi:DNA-binding response OmpR family regulator
MKILLIEDDPDDVELLEEALTKYEVLYKMDVVRDGNAAINHIKTSTHYPDVIILDFNLPKVHGREVILTIKSTSTFNRIPLLILTTSSAKEDIDYSYQHGADKYLLKPINLEQIKTTVDTIVALVNKN